MKIMQGDEYAIYVNLRQDGIVINPNLVDDIEICIGDSIRKTYSSENVLFDSKEQKWYFRLLQSETLNMAEGQHEVIGRVKYTGIPYNDVVGVKLGNIIVMPTTSREVL